MAEEKVVVKGEVQRPPENKVAAEQDAKAEKAQKKADKEQEKADAQAPEAHVKAIVDGIKEAQKTPEGLPPTATDPTLAGLLEPEQEFVPNLPYYEHPASIKGYDILDLTSPYNMAHTEAPVPGYFRISLHSDPTIHQDIVTDAPFYVHGKENKLSKNTEALIHAAIDKLNLLKKG